MGLAGRIPTPLEKCCSSTTSTHCSSHCSKRASASVPPPRCGGAPGGSSWGPRCGVAVPPNSGLGLVIASAASAADTGHPVAHQFHAVGSWPTRFVPGTAVSSKLPPNGTNDTMSTIDLGGQCPRHKAGSQPGDQPRMTAFPVRGCPPQARSDRKRSLNCRRYNRLVCPSVELSVAY